MLEIQDFSFSFRDHRIFENLRAHCLPGEALLFEGPSGSGKSTLFRTLLGLEGPPSERIFHRGRSLKEWLRRDEREFRRSVQGIFSGGPSRWDPRLSLEVQCREAVEAGGVVWSRERFLRSLEGVGIPPETLRRRAHEASRGELQRLLLLRSLEREPSLILLDEPYQGLDPFSITLVARLLNLYRDRGGTLVLFLQPGEESGLRGSERKIPLKKNLP